MILYMYTAPGQVQTTLGDKTLMSTERPYRFAHLLQVLKKLLWSPNLYILLFYHMYIAPGPGQTIL